MTKILIDKYLNGETSLAEEHGLLHLLQAKPYASLTSEERAILMMVSYHKDSDKSIESTSFIKSTISIKSSPAMETIESIPTEEDIFTANYEEEYDRIVSSRKRQLRWKYAKIAAAVALLAIVSTVGIFHNTRTDENLAVAYVYGAETTDEELVMSMMHNTMSEILSCSTTDEKLHELFNPE